MVEFDRSRMKFLVGWLFLMVFWVFDVWLFLNPPENFSFFHNQPVNLVAGVLSVLPVAMFARMTLALRPCLKVTQDELVADTLVRGFWLRSVRIQWKDIKSVRLRSIPGRERSGGQPSILLSSGEEVALYTAATRVPGVSRQDTAQSIQAYLAEVLRDRNQS